jgi:hypothetical protein
VEHEVHTADGGTAESRTALFGGTNTAGFLKILVEFLEIAGGQLVKLDISDTGNGVNIDRLCVLLLVLSKE